ncbi:MAG TPA: biotin/lipoyl-containing protein [Kineosporiaceae bacterium]
MDMKLKVTVNGTAYDVDVEVEEERPPTLGPLVFGGNGHAVAAAPVAPTNVSAPADEGKVLRAPISGTVTKIVAEPGTAVEQGAVLLILEAMKMETEITAPVGGTVADVAVAPGDAVAGGEILLTWA